RSPMTTWVFLTVLVFAVAMLYSSVGHAGASGYLAVLALAGMAPEVMKPTALVLNILVAMVSTFRFTRAGLVSWPIFWRFAATSIPLALLGGAISLPANVYRPVIGAVLVLAATHVLVHAAEPARSRHLPAWVGLAC